MALFPEGGVSALKAAYEFEEALAQFNAIQFQKGFETIQIGVGIHTGKMILGTIGHDQRLETTVISDAVNVASRVEGLTKTYQARIIATDEVIKDLKNADQIFHYRFLGKVKVKGKSATIAIYEFLSESDQAKLSYQQEYKKGLSLLENNQFQDAEALFEVLFERNPSDKALEMILAQNSKSGRNQ